MSLTVKSLILSLLFVWYGYGCKENHDKNQHYQVYKQIMISWIFTLAGLLALGIALLTVSWQCWKATIRNPVEALKYE